ncbi:methyl-accepting chemotaxis protein [Deinococcus radiodurans]|jgi:Methyl-accepting chemotaxis protein|uniref:Methyl-accepting chemotaxis protein n=1 Tax=Deinococcus radiodurans (strain ATCC 13939 / DSM 20539 / JCM 16871 / CCUG 27074 / LMG 4051 / NBRC 15346 / NCIMB 9279 / VKM B-1422 / R1) TaxID=243230 RepID=Q9RYG5_DEIRA|nr:methyl-accepting chemotaxis protein [Deinococcus radiodurans]AAF12433.1 methyl-accepting chemotaxis protein [Deinococcus radiodurans R1 = ATCC 13939 = DSM 20539]ANC72863.1 hypothetical protein A2G07_13440 [Deinococcus radiodurans R1 = ATCC 13939 = DSM 20539]QEM73134.1 methyl-accepting chemotaxis protein [Deinococcus radiodurans]QIP30499.1 methyl-accepting chemotaxis protein [Deinococcus radiodurans]QIP33444.1 methyl-accepting chemotaxis protein [Deinococcus radiodurans]
MSQQAELNRLEPPFSRQNRKSSDLSRAPQRSGLLGRLGIGQKLGLMALSLGVPVVGLAAWQATQQLSRINHTVTQLHGLQQTEPLAAVQSGMYLYVYGLTHDDPQERAKGEKEASQGFATLAPLLRGRPAQQLKATQQDWQALQLTADSADSRAILGAYEALSRNNQQLLVDDMLSAAGLDSEQDPALGSLIMANQRRIPKLSSELQLAALTADMLTLTPNDAGLRQQLLRHTAIISDVLDAYRGDLARAYSLRPELRQTLQAPTDKMTRAIDDSLQRAQAGLDKGTYGDALAKSYSLSLNSLRDSYIATITSVGQELLGRAKGGYVTLALQFGLLLLLLGAVAALLFALMRAITRPLSQLTDASRQLSAGDLNVDVPVTTQDELALLSRSFNDAAAELRRNQLRVDQEREEAQQMQSNIGEFLDVTMDIADGDLTRRGKVTDDVLGNVVDSINLMVGELADTLREVQGASQSVNQGSAQMLTTTAQIGQGSQLTAEQSRRLAERAAEISLRIQDLARSAQDSAAAAQQALQTSQQGQQAVQGTLQGMAAIREGTQDVAQTMQALSERSEQIQGIVDTITQISSQTNLLSLHASIEAAGAGEAGSRFAVVADEVRQLAEQTNEATGRVAALITTLQSDIAQVRQGVQSSAAQVEKGYRVAEEAGSRLQELGDIAQRSAQLAGQMSDVSGAQARDIEQLGQGVQDIAALAEGAQQSVQRGRGAAEQLRALATQLDQSLSRFRLG